MTELTKSLVGRAYIFGLGAVCIVMAYLVFLPLTPVGERTALRRVGPWVLIGGAVVGIVVFTLDRFGHRLWRRARGQRSIGVIVFLILALFMLSSRAALFLFTLAAVGFMVPALTPLVSFRARDKAHEGRPWDAGSEEHS